MKLERFEEMVQLALGLEREQTKVLGRELHPEERRWVIRAGFRVRYGHHIGAGLAEKVIEVVEAAETEVL